MFDFVLRWKVKAKIVPNEFLIQFSVALICRIQMSFFGATEHTL